MVNDMSPRRSALALVVLLACPACGEMREAEPVAKTVPAAAAVLGTALFVAFVVVRSTVLRWPGTRTGNEPPLAYPRATVALVLAPAAVVTALLVGGLSWGVAFGYREAHIDLFTWEETLVFTVVMTGGALLLLAASAGIGRGLTSCHRRERVASRIVLGLAIVVTSVAVPGAGVVWLPAAITCSLTGRRRDPAQWSAGRWEAPAP